MVFVSFCRWVRTFIVAGREKVMPVRVAQAVETLPDALPVKQRPRLSGREDSNLHFQDHWVCKLPPLGTGIDSCQSVSLSSFTGLLRSEGRPPVQVA